MAHISVSPGFLFITFVFAYIQHTHKSMHNWMSFCVSNTGFVFFYLQGSFFLDCDIAVHVGCDSHQLPCNIYRAGLEATLYVVNLNCIPSSFCEVICCRALLEDFSFASCVTFSIHDTFNTEWA